MKDLQSWWMVIKLAEETGWHLWKNSHLWVNSPLALAGSDQEEARCRAEEAFSCRRWFCTAGGNIQLDEKEGSAEGLLPNHQFKISVCTLFCSIVCTYEFECCLIERTCLLFIERLVYLILLEWKFLRCGVEEEWEMEEEGAKGKQEAVEEEGEAA